MASPSPTLAATQSSTRSALRLRGIRGHGGNRTDVAGGAGRLGQSVTFVAAVEAATSRRLTFSTAADHWLPLPLGGSSRHVVHLESGPRSACRPITTATSDGDADLLGAGSRRPSLSARTAPGVVLVPRAILEESGVGRPEGRDEPISPGGGLTNRPGSFKLTKKAPGRSCT